MTRRAVLGLIAVLMLAAGLGLGLLPTAVEGVSCGSRLHRGDAALQADIDDIGPGGDLSHSRNIEGRCDDSQKGRRPISISLLVVGGVIAFVALVQPHTAGRQPAI